MKSSQSKVVFTAPSPEGFSDIAVDRFSLAACCLCLLSSLLFWSISCLLAVPVIEVADDCGRLDCAADGGGLDVSSGSHPKSPQPLVSSSLPGAAAAIVNTGTSAEGTTFVTK